LGYTIIYNSQHLSFTPCISYEIAVPGQVNLKAFQQLNSVVRYILNLLLMALSLSVGGPSAAFRLRWNADICVWAYYWNCKVRGSGNAFTGKRICGWVS